MKFLITLLLLVGLLVSSCEKADPGDKKKVLNPRAKKLWDNAKARLDYSNELNKRLPIRLDSASTLYKVDSKSGNLIYFIQINTQGFKATGNSFGQQIPDTNTMKRFIMQQTLNQVRTDPSYSPLKKTFKGLAYNYVNERGENLFSFVINF
jgi:hypothetical protein